jgi:hypothetical protein
VAGTYANNGTDDDAIDVGLVVRERANSGCQSIV